MITKAAILTAIDVAMESVSPEMIVICEPVTVADDITDYHDKAMLILAEQGRQVGMLIAVAGIDPAAQTWAQYFSAQETLIDGLLGSRVAVVPQLHGNDVGVLAGRLCDRATSIADTPMRVRTGAVLGLGDTPVDSTGANP